MPENTESQRARRIRDMDVSAIKRKLAYHELHAEILRKALAKKKG